MPKTPILSITAALLLALAAGCERTSPVAKEAQEVAKAADARVAQLEKELAELKAGKAKGEGDPDAAAHVAQAQVKVLDRRLAQAKVAAAKRHQEAETLAAAPKAEADRTVLVEVPAGTRLEVALAGDLATDKVQAGDPWEGTLAGDVEINGRIVWPKGTPVKGVVAQSLAAGRLQSGQGGLGIRLSTVGASDVEAGTYVVTGGARGERNAKFIGGTAALGALVGILSGKGHDADHALGGAAIGAAAGTALAAGTADTVIRIPAAKAVPFTLSAPERVVLKQAK